MALHIQRSIEELKKKLLSLCGQVEDNLWQAVKSIKQNDVNLAERVIAKDVSIDQMEVDVEEECLKILALHQPVATDLRFIITALKINNDLERIGDLAVNIAERTPHLCGLAAGEFPLEFEDMAERSQAMLRRSLDAMVNMDCRLAHEVCLMDNEIDAENVRMYEQLKVKIHNNPDKVDVYLNLLSVSRQLERIGDHATNIAQDVIYMSEGIIVRHKAEAYRQY